MSEAIQGHGCTPEYENKTGTIRLAPAGGAVTAAAPRPSAGRCGYVVAAGAAPFCDRPALSGGSYCAWHRALCAVAPGSPGFAALAASQAAAGDAPLPPGLARRRALPLPEPLEESDDERLAGLALPPAAIAHDE